MFLIVYTQWPETSFRSPNHFGTIERRLPCSSRRSLRSLLNSNENQLAIAVLFLIVYTQWPETSFRSVDFPWSLGAIALSDASRRVSDVRRERVKIRYGIDTKPVSKAEQKMKDHCKFTDVTCSSVKFTAELWSLQLITIDLWDTQQLAIDLWDTTDHGRSVRFTFTTARNRSLRSTTAHTICGIHNSS